MFNRIRIVVFFLALGITYLITKRSKIQHKKRVFCFAVILYIVFLSLVSMFPLENLFINFKTLEQAFHYMETGKAYDVVYGDSSCMVAYTKSDSEYGYLIIPKHNDTYKLPRQFSSKEILYQVSQDGYFEIVQFEDSSDYYLYGSIVSEATQQKITGPDGKSFETYERPVPNTGRESVLLYGTLDPQIVESGEIELDINGNIVTLSP